MLTLSLSHKFEKLRLKTHRVSKIWVLILVIFLLERKYLLRAFFKWLLSLINSLLDAFESNRIIFSEF